jgi:hypothetical protein
VAGVKQISVEVAGAKDLALIGNDDTVWLVVPIRWWDLSTILFWLLLPSDRRAYINLTLANGTKVKCKAARVATRYMKTTGIYK